MENTWLQLNNNITENVPLTLVFLRKYTGAWRKEKPFYDLKIPLPESNRGKNSLQFFISLFAPTLCIIECVRLRRVGLVSQISQFMNFNINLP